MMQIKNIFGAVLDWFGANLALKQKNYAETVTSNVAICDEFIE